MALEIFGNSSLVETLAWTLLHSVWQIGLIAFCLFITLRSLSRTNANLRYLLSVLALSLALILPFATFFYVSNFHFDSVHKTVTDTNISGKILQEQIQTADDPLAGKLQIYSAKTTQPANSVITWQNRLEQYLSAYSPLLVSFWLIGMMLFSLRLFGGFWQLHKFKTKEVFEPSDDWQAKFTALCGKLNITNNIRLLQSKLVESPMVIGWVKPVILVPAGVFLQMDVYQLETIIAHELMHIRRFDYLVNFTQSFVEILFFYHPCVWWISKEIRRERECACDDAVLQTLANAKFTYANALANLESFRQIAKQNDPHLTVAANGGKLMNRIERIVKKETTGRSGFQNSLWSASLVSMLILAFLVSVFWANISPDVNQKPDRVITGTKKMAVGFVAIPPNHKAEIDNSFDETARLLITELQKNNVPAIGFVTGSKILKNNRMSKANEDIVRMWRDAGLEVGIGGYKHLRFYDTDFDAYVSNVKSNIEIVKPILAESKQEIRYFSYPYLNTGKDIETKARFEQWLAENNLQFIPYTFDNQEWLYSYAYDLARENNSPETMNQIKQKFLDYMEKMVVHYEGYSNDLFGKEIPQTLVLTTSRLVADSADDLFGMFRSRGYEFVSMQEALTDEAYQQTETYAGRAGISWLERWTMTLGKKLRPEPEVAGAVDDLWRNKNRINDLPKPPMPKPPAVAPTPPPKPPIPPEPPKPPKPPKDAPPADPVAPPSVAPEPPKAPKAS